MITPKYQYSNYLISVHFDPKFVPETLKEQIIYCENLLMDLGELARDDGKRLFATYSIASGKSGIHAHFAVNWMPSTISAKKRARNEFANISRYTITRLLVNNFFVVDNPSQAIKRITHNKKFVTEYVIFQPKENQNVLFSGFFEYPIIDPTPLVKNSVSYSSHGFFDKVGIDTQSGCINRIYLIIMISIISFITISTITAMIS